MKKLVKVALYLAGGIFAFLLISVLGVNMYVESAAVQAQLEAALSKELKVPVRLTRIRFSLWSGLNVSGLQVAQVDPNESRPFLQAPVISARLAAGPLLSRRLVIRELLISSPSIVWRQNKKGRWELPREEEKEIILKALPAQEEPPPSPLLPETPTAEATPKPELAPKEEKKKLEFRVAAARLEDATFQFLDRKGRPIAVFEGVTVSCPIAKLHEARGSAVIRRVILHDKLVIQNMVTPFEYVQGQLSLPNLDAQLAEGEISGSFYLYTAMKNVPFSLDLRFKRISLRPLLEQLVASATASQSQGTLEGYLSLQGLTAQSKTITGSGHVALLEGTLDHNPMLQSIGTALKIDELTRLELKDANLAFWVAEERVHIDDLKISSSNLSLHAKGESRFNGRLRLDAALIINQTIARQLPGWVETNFEPVEEYPNLKQVHFRVRGTVGDPETDLMRVMVGEKLEQQASKLFRKFQSFTGKKKKEETESSEE